VNAQLKLVHIMDMADYGFEFINTQDEELMVKQEAAKELASKPLKQAAERAVEFGISTETQLALPQHTDRSVKILELAAEWKADLIVMGTHGRDGIDHFLLGSVAEGVVRHATVPVMLVRVSD
jgi:nucleotide-binding universal stress UspA family protein